VETREVAVREERQLTPEKATKKEKRKRKRKRKQLLEMEHQKLHMRKRKQEEIVKKELNIMQTRQTQQFNKQRKLPQPKEGNM